MGRVLYPDHIFGSHRGGMRLLRKNYGRELGSDVSSSLAFVIRTWFIYLVGRRGAGPRLFQLYILAQASPF